MIPLSTIITAEKTVFLATSSFPAAADNIMETMTATSMIVTQMANRIAPKRSPTPLGKNFGVMHRRKNSTCKQGRGRHQYQDRVFRQHVR